MPTWLERGINVSLIIACGAFVAIAWQRVSSKARVAGVNGTTATSTYVHGDRLPTLSGVEFSKARQSLVIFVSRTCQYCLDGTL